MAGSIGLPGDPSELKVGDVMTRGVIGVERNDTVQKAAEVMGRNDISAVVVLQKGKGAVGIVTERDIIVKVVGKGKNPSQLTASDIMTSPLITIEPNASVDDAARVMRDRHIHHLIVSRKNKLVGIISEFDIVRVEPALHTLIREHSMWDIASVYAAEGGSITGSCESCDNYSESLRIIDGRMVCDDCIGE